MTSPVLSQSNIRAGTCPHGLPQGTCPICNRQNSVSMGGISMVKHSKPSNEWSYQKCYNVGMQIKAAHKHRLETQNFWNNQFQNALQISKNIQNFTDKLNNFIQNIQSPTVQSIAQFIMNNAVAPIFNQLSKFIDKIAEFNQKAINIIYSAGEKIVSIVGEIKNFIQQKIFEDLKKKAKKFMLFCLSVIEDENYQNDDTLAIFKSRELKKYIVKILKKNKDERRNYQSE